MSDYLTTNVQNKIMNSLLDVEDDVIVLIPEYLSKYDLIEMRLTCNDIRNAIEFPIQINDKQSLNEFIKVMKNEEVTKDYCFRKMKLKMRMKENLLVNI